MKRPFAAIISWGVLALLVIVIAGGGAFWWHAHGALTGRRLTVASTWPLEVSVPGRQHLMGSESGFLYRDGLRTFVFCNWQGKQLWKVQAPEADAANWDATFSDIEAYKQIVSLSPDGHYLAACVAEGLRRHILLWKDGDGVLESHTDLRDVKAGLLVTNAGVVYLWPTEPDRSAATVTAFIDEKTFAEGVWSVTTDPSLTAKRPPDTQIKHLMLTPDGAALLAWTGTDYDYVALTIEGKKLKMVRNYFRAAPTDDLTPLAGNLALTDDGAVWDAGGMGRGPDGWAHSVPDPDGLSLVETQGEGARVATYDPANPEADPKTWDFPGSGPFREGRLAVGARAAAIIRDDAHPALLLCASRGALRGSLALTVSDVGLAAWVAPDGDHAIVEDYTPAPDGKTLIVSGQSMKRGRKAIWVLQ